MGNLRNKQKLAARECLAAKSAGLRYRYMDDRRPGIRRGRRGNGLSYVNADGKHEFAFVDSQTQAKRNVLRAIEAVAKRLGNTKAVCRKCHIHLGVLNDYLEGRLVSSLNRSRGVRFPLFLPKRRQSWRCSSKK